MWVVPLDNGKFKFVERYTHELTGKQKFVSTTLTSQSAQAHKKATKILSQKIAKKNKESSADNIRFGESFAKFFDFYKQTIKPRTVERHENNIAIIKRYIADDVLVSKLTTNFLEDMLHDIHHQANYSKSTTKQIKSLLSMYFKWCKKRDFIDINPILDVEISFKKKRPVAVTDQYLTKDELKQLIDYTRSMNSRRADMIEMLAYTGLRYGELTNLSVDDYNNDEINVTDAKTPTGIRTIPITDNVKEILDRNIAFNKSAGIQSNKIFISSFGNQLGNSNFNRQLRDAAKHLGIKKHVTAHIFRHTYITILASLGVDIKSTMYLVGHAKPDVTLSIYTHVSNKMAQTAVNKMNHFKLD